MGEATGSAMAFRLFLGFRGSPPWSLPFVFVVPRHGLSPCFI